MYEDILTSLGLTDEQTQIYLSLLSRGPQTVSDLTKSTKVQRTYIYRIAEELIGKGLVAIEGKAKKTTFTPLSPDHLLRQAEDAKTKAERAHLALEGILPRLKEKYALIDQRPVVTYYEGIEGIKKVYMDTIQEGKEILAIVETSKVDKDIYKWVTTEYVEHRVKARIPVRAIVASGSKTEEYIKKNEAELRETVIVESNKFPFENEINIYGQKIALINHRIGTQLIGIIIDNSSIARTYRSWFELTWQTFSK